MSPPPPPPLPIVSFLFFLFLPLGYSFFRLSSIIILLFFFLLSHFRNMPTRIDRPARPSFFQLGSPSSPSVLSILLSVGRKGVTFFLFPFRIISLDHSSFVDLKVLVLIFVLWLGLVRDSFLSFAPVSLLAKVPSSSFPSFLTQSLSLLMSPIKSRCLRSHPAPDGLLCQDIFGPILNFASPLLAE